MQSRFRPYVYDVGCNLGPFLKKKKKTFRGSLARSNINRLICLQHIRTMFLMVHLYVSMKFWQCGWLCISIHLEIACLVMHAAKEAQTNYHYILYPWSFCPMCPFSVPFSSSLTILPSPCMSRDEALLIVEVCDCNKLWQLTMQAFSEWEERVIWPIHGAEDHASKAQTILHAWVPNLHAV